MNKLLQVDYIKYMFFKKPSNSDKNLPVLICRWTVFYYYNVKAKLEEIVNFCGLPRKHEF